MRSVLPVGLTLGSMTDAVSQFRALRSGQSMRGSSVKITVVGLGKIGLPLAVQFASRGHQVLGADVSAPTVVTVNAGKEPFPGEAYLQEKLADVVARDLFRATTDTAAAVSESDVVVVVVPLFVDGEGIPDFGWMDAATGDIARGLKPGTLVVYETTLPVGTTRTRWKPTLQDGSGLTEGTDFRLVFSPGARADRSHLRRSVKVSQPHGWSLQRGSQTRSRLLRGSSTLRPSWVQASQGMLLHAWRPELPLSSARPPTHELCPTRGNNECENG